MGSRSRAEVIGPENVLATLADLAPDTKEPSGRHIAGEDRRLMPFNTVGAFESGWLGSGYPGGQEYDFHIRDRVTPFLKRARLHDDARLRLGWLWVDGSDDDGDRVQFPLVSAPIEHRGVVARLVNSVTPRVGEPELTELIENPATRRRLETTMQFGGGVFVDGLSEHLGSALIERLPRLRSWASEASAAAGYATQRLVPLARTGAPSPDGRYLVRAQVEVYLAVPPKRSATVASSLRRWKGPELAETAFASCYGFGDLGPVELEADSQHVHSPLVLSPVQRDVVLRARSHPVTVLSGPPGTGKSQTIAAVALDEVARGASVLVAAPSDGAVDALVALLEDVPGPDPLVFGASERRRAAEHRLGQGGGLLVDDEVLQRADERAAEASTLADELRGGVHDLLAAEAAASGTNTAVVSAARRIAPAWFADADLGVARKLLARAESQPRLLGGLRRRRRATRVAAHAGASDPDLGALTRALTLAQAVRHARELELGGGLELGASWDDLVARDDEDRRRLGERLEAYAHHESRVGRRARATMAAVAASLRSGRATRRQRLSELDGRDLTTALPLWVGTLRDIDDLVPQTAGMFDLVVIDEASQVDQILAAPALMRARRALVVGDPKQLRHVSFISERATATALETNGIREPGLRARLDVRRVSLFDLAAGVAPTRFLDEHFRSDPHLIGFSARRFYDGDLQIATTHPSNHARDCISVRRVDGVRDSDGANPDEVDAVLDVIRERQRHASARHHGPVPRIGVIAPLRAQADAIESRVVSELELDEIDELGLRVGTVHGFQGCERDLVIVSLALDPSATGSQRAFINDRNLFNVMVTRARRELIVVTSLPAETPGLIGEYLRYGDAAPSEPASELSSDGVVRRIAADLSAQGATVRTGYRAGRHVVDLVIGDGDRALGVLFGVHRDGPDAHIDRHLALRRAGWELREVYATAWEDRVAELSVELAVEAERRRV